VTRLGAGLPGTALTKASLATIDSWLVGGLTFKYNPEEFSLDKSAEWTNPGIAHKQKWVSPKYLKTNAGKISMTIFFDAFEELAGDVSGDVAKLINWTKPQPSPTGLQYPPLLQFRWGMSQALQGMYFYLESVSANYTMFRMDGTPIRATCRISLVEATNPANRQNPTSGSMPGLETHVLSEGETLHSVAWARYGQASWWRAIAEFNGIDDPFRVAPGTRLLIPPRRDAAGLA
jgi:hypothetical protein